MRLKNDWRDNVWCIVMKMVVGWLIKNIRVKMILVSGLSFNG